MIGKQRNVGGDTPQQITYCRGVIIVIYDTSGV